MPDVLAPEGRTLGMIGPEHRKIVIMGNDFIALKNHIFPSRIVHCLMKGYLRCLCRSLQLVFEASLNFARNVPGVMSSDRQKARQKLLASINPVCRAMLSTAASVSFINTCAV